MSRAAEIVDNLLGLAEDINTRLPGLLRRFADQFNEEQIRQIAEADPTKDTSCEYINWLLDVRQTGMWDGDIADMKQLLTNYHALKKKPRFLRVGGHKDISEYRTIVELRQHIEKTLTPDWNEAQAKAGTEAVNKVGPIILLKITNFDAAKKAAIEPGSAAPDNADFNDIIQHAGTGEPGWPWTGWCTQMDCHYRSYTGGPLYVVKEGKKPIIQIYFADRSGAAKDIKDQPITPELAQKAAPVLVDVPEINELLAPEQSLLDRDITYQINRLANRWINEKVHGFTNRAGEFVAPKPGMTNELALQAFRQHIPAFFKMWREAVLNNDRQLLAQTRERGRETRPNISAEIKLLLDAVSQIKPPGADDLLCPALKDINVFMQLAEEAMSDL